MKTYHSYWQVLFYSNWTIYLLSIQKGDFPKWTYLSIDNLQLILLNISIILMKNKRKCDGLMVPNALLLLTRPEHWPGGEQELWWILRDYCAASRHSASEWWLQLQQARSEWAIADLSIEVNQTPPAVNRQRHNIIHHHQSLHHGLAALPECQVGAGHSLPRLLIIQSCQDEERQGEMSMTSREICQLPVLGLRRLDDLLDRVRHRHHHGGNIRPPPQLLASILLWNQDSLPLLAVVARHQVDSNLVVVQLLSSLLQGLQADLQTGDPPRSAQQGGGHRPAAPAVETPELQAGSQVSQQNTTNY